MNKHLPVLIVLLGFGLVGCVTTESVLAIHPRESGSHYGSWQYKEVIDEFNGKFLVSLVNSTDGQAWLRIATSAERGNKVDANIIEYYPGDSYICSLGGIRLRQIYTNAAGESYEVDELYSVSSDKKTMVLRGIWRKGARYIKALNYFDNLLVRTTDSCGTTIDKRFDISGSSHLHTL